MINKLCTYVGCRTVVKHNNDGSSPRCAKHQVDKKNRVRPEYLHHYDDQGNNIYRTPKWRRVSKAKRKLNPLCEHCLAMGISRMAQLVDHIIEIEDGGPMWQLENLQSLCNGCHNRKTGQEKRKRSKKSEYPSLSDFK